MKADPQAHLVAPDEGHHLLSEEDLRHHLPELHGIELADVDTRVNVEEYLEACGIESTGDRDLDLLVREHNIEHERVAWPTTCTYHLTADRMVDGQLEGMIVGTCDGRWHTRWYVVSADPTNFKRRAIVRCSNHAPMIARYIASGGNTRTYEPDGYGYVVLHVEEREKEESV